MTLNFRENSKPFNVYYVLTYADTNSHIIMRVNRSFAHDMQITSQYRCQLLLVNSAVPSFMPKKTKNHFFSLVLFLMYIFFYYLCT